MTDNEITACLNAIGLLFDGTVTLTKKIGREEPDVESTMHPFFGLFCCLSGLEELTWQAMHAGGSLKLNLENEEQVRKVFSLKVETGSLACLGCGWEHNCTTKGCAILQEAEKVLRAMHQDLKTLGDCATCRHDKAIGYDDAPCTCCMRGEKWEWRGEKQ